MVTEQEKAAIAEREKDTMEFLRKITPIVKKSLMKRLGFREDMVNRVCTEEEFIRGTLVRYLMYSKTRYVVLQPNNCLGGVSFMDDDYSQYIADTNPTALVPSEGEKVVTEWEGLKALCEFEKEDTKQFYKWGYNFSIEDGVLKVRTTTCKSIAIKPMAANSIEIIQTR